MSRFISELKAAWVGARQRAFHQGTRGIMTPEDRQVLEGEFDHWLARHDAEVAAKALEEVASAWQVNGWVHDMPEKGAERAQVILHMAQAATEMLRLRAAEYRKAVRDE